MGDVNMSKRFSKIWDKEPKEPLGERLRETVAPSPPLKARIDMVARSLEAQINKLNIVYQRLKERDKALFNKLVNAYVQNEIERAYVYANEIANIRKIAKTVVHSKIALEQVVLRLNTIKTVGDIVAQLGPAINVVSNVRNKLSGILPEAEDSLRSVGETLNSIIIDVGEITGSVVEPSIYSEEAMQILNEAKHEAEKKLGLAMTPEGESEETPGP